LEKTFGARYEQELRLFTIEEVKTHWMAASDKNPANPWQRIFHHGTNFISGIIFGPRVTENYKRYIEATIAGNREHADEKYGFYSFDTILNPHGQLMISAASMVIDTNLARRIYEGDEKEKLLTAFGIAAPVQDH